MMIALEPLLYSVYSRAKVAVPEPGLQQWQSGWGAIRLGDDPVMLGIYPHKLYWNITNPSSRIEMLEIRWILRYSVTIYQKLQLRSLPFVITGLVSLQLLLLPGCHPSNFRSRAAQGSQLVLSALTDPKTFNYANNQSFPNIFLFAYEGLTRENGVTGEVEPALAESWEMSADKKRIVFTLRQGLKWSDGHPLTADDVVFTYRDIVANPDIPTDAKDSLRIGPKGLFPQVRKLSDRRVEFLLPEPFAPLLRATSAPDGVLIMPKHALAETLRTKGSDGNLKFISTWNTDTPVMSYIY